MWRLPALSLIAALTLGAAKVPTVDYRLGAEVAQDGAPPVLTVEMRLQGDADGETRIALPDSFADGKDAWRYVSDLTASGATVETPDPAHRVLRHQPNARLTIRYRVQTAYDADPATGAGGNPYRGPIIRPTWFDLLGEFVFAAPEGRERQPATFRWSRLPKGWRAVSDLEHGAQGRPMTVADVSESLTMGGPGLMVEERPIPGGVLRVAAPAGSPFALPALSDEIARNIAAQRTFWNDQAEPFLVTVAPITVSRPGAYSTGGTGRSDAFALYSTPGREASLAQTIAHEYAHTWFPNRTGRMPDKDEARFYWFSEGFADLYAIRLALRAGLITPDDAVARMDAILAAYDKSPVRTAPSARIVADFWSNPDVQRLPYQRGALLALKWDEAIRIKTGGKLDLDDVVLKMRDHYQQFAPGQGPDPMTGFLSAAWVVAGIDLGFDVARYADGGAVVDLPETLFDGCLDAAVTVTPGFDSGFDHVASAKAEVVQGVRRRGPAWNSGLRDGMRIDRMDVRTGDVAREIVITVRPARGGRAREIRYWPYGDVDVETRRLRLAIGLSDDARKACGRKIGGL